MGSHDSFGYLRHKLWPKKRSGVKLPIWLPTIKNWESTWLPCMKVACHIPLESFWWGLQLCFRPHLNQRFAHKVYGAPKWQESQLWEFRDSHLGDLGQNVIWMWASWRGTKYTIRGKVVASPKFGSWWVLWVRVCPWLVLAPKVLKLCTNQLVIWFV
jgi:hypothetical protein